VSANQGPLLVLSTWPNEALGFSVPDFFCLLPNISIKGQGAAEKVTKSPLLSFHILSFRVLLRLLGDSLYLFHVQSPFRKPSLWAEQSTGRHHTL